MNDLHLKQAKPYSELAEYYNVVMAHVNYKKWAKYILKILSNFGFDNGLIIDLSFGTGLFNKYFSTNSFRIFGADLSLHMLSRYTLENSTHQIPLFVNDICHMAIQNEKADILIFLYDSLNYLNTRPKLRKAFSEVKRILKPGGLCIFDAVTQRLCENYFSNSLETIKVGDIEIIRESFFDKGDLLQYNDFIFKRIGENLHERHIQKIYSIKDIKSELRRAQFEIIATYDGLGFGKPSEKSERVHFVCKKND